jgi:hypothetical protein
MFKRLSQCLSKISPEYWRIGFTSVLVPSISWLFLNFYSDWKEQQKFIVIEPAMTKLLEGNWEGYGIQPVDEDSEPRLKAKEITIQDQITNADKSEYKSYLGAVEKSNIEGSGKSYIVQQGNRSSLLRIFSKINMCTNKKAIDWPLAKWTFFQAHLINLKVNKR